MATSHKLVLAFETSCDETCAAVVDGSLNVLSNVVSSQIEIHKLYGGVVPEIASRNHVLAIQTVCEEALNQAGKIFGNLTDIAATTQPGLRGAVMVGHVFGESLANALDIPFTEVNHLAGHIASVAITYKDLKPPFLSLLVSGGHTSLYKINNWQDVHMLCETTDDACGEAFDKVAKMLGLGYPGGVQIQHVAEQSKGDVSSYITFVQKPNYQKSSFSYSGLKTAVLNYLNRKKQKGEDIDVPFVCASFQHEAVEQLVIKCIAELQKSGIRILSVCGGVSANLYLRKRMTEECEKKEVSVFFPEFKYCTDNAAMIGAAKVLNCLTEI